jgi:hypothetical protein
MTESSDLTPQQDAVRRLLAEARHDGPTPPEVVARLEATLSSLQAERAADGETAADKAPVIDLGALRRRRLASVGVLAAAAVVVAGVALGQMLPQGSDGGADSATSADSATEFGAQEPEAGSDSADDDGEMSGEGPTASERSSKYAAPQATLPEVDLDADLDSTLTELRSSASSKASLDAADLMVACQVGAIGKGRQVYVEIDGQRGVVVYRLPQDARQEAEVYLCGDAEPLRTVSLPAP